MTGLMLFGFTAFLLLILTKPKWGSFLIWPILFTYPHGWWAAHDFLPLGAGADDVFFVILFLAVLIRRNLMGGVPFHFGYAFWTITGFLLVALVATFFGFRESDSYDRLPYIRDMLKLVSYWCLFYAVVHCIDNEYDLRRQLFMFSLATLLGSLVVIVHGLFPHRLGWYLAPVTVEAIEEGSSRASGAFMNPNAASGTLACAVPLMIAAMKLTRHKIAKLIILGAVFVALAAILMTQSRSGFFALAIVLVSMAVVGRYKRIGWTVIITAFLAASIFTGAKELFQERLSRIYSPETGAWEANVEGRFRTWGEYFETASAQNYLFGQGRRRGIEKNGMESHSAYVSMITVYGIGGVVWGIIAFLLFMKKYYVLAHFPDAFIKVMASVCLWALMAWSIYALTSDALSSYYPRYVLFFTVVLLDRAYAAAEQKSAEIFSWDYMNTDEMMETGNSLNVAPA